MCDTNNLISFSALMLAVISGLWSFFVKRNTDRVKSELDHRLKILEEEKSIRLFRLADQQLKVMIDLYEKTADLNGGMQYYSGQFDWGKLREDKNFKELFENICSFQTAFYRSKVFLTKELEKEFKDLIQIAQRTKSFYRRVQRGGDSEHYNANKAKEDMDYIHENLPTVIERIEKHFRNLWNIES